MKNDGKTLVIKCDNLEKHNSENKDKGEGNILMFLRKDSIFIKCTDHRCKRWNRVIIRIPGVNIDFSNATFIQKKMPESYHFDARKASVIIEDK